MEPKTTYPSYLYYPYLVLITVFPRNNSEKSDIMRGHRGGSKR